MHALPEERVTGRRTRQAPSGSNLQAPAQSFSSYLVLLAILLVALLPVCAASGQDWGQLGLDIDGEAAFDYSGWSVSLSADGLSVAIGATHNAANGTNSGHVRIYDWNASSSLWEQRGTDIDGEAAEHQSGFSVSLSADGQSVAIGAPYNEGGLNSGHVRVYELK